jgi:hypothetical protein
MSEASAKALGQLVGGLITFLVDWAIVKLVWDGLLVQLFHLPVITWFQALLIYWFCETLFKQRRVTIVQDLTK